MKFDREIYFDAVRPMFGGSLNQGQVDGQNAILGCWEVARGTDLRHLAYMLATTKHETASEMLPIEEYGKGEGMSYGVPDPETKQTYYGRGFVQLTWRENYARADAEIGLENDRSCEWHAENALVPTIAARIMFAGMAQGWFRSSDGLPETLGRYFNETTDDPYNAREIINGDKTFVPSWSHGVSIGNLIADYHEDFFTALATAEIDTKPPVPSQRNVVWINVDVSDDVDLRIVVNGRAVVETR